MKIIKIIVCLILCALPLTMWAENAEKVAKIEITGNESIDKGFIMNAIKMKENDPYDLNKIREDMKSIYKTGFFSDVQIDVKDSDKGKVVTFVVIERAPVKAIYVSGNKQIKTNDIKDKLKIRTNSVLNIEKIKESMDEIRKLYASKGYYAAKVGYEISYEEGYYATVRFLIDEPVKAYVRKISFKGNKAFKAGKLKSVMKVSEKGILSWATGSGILDEENLDDDRKRLEAFYHDNGYVRINVGVPDVTVSKDGKSLSIIMPIEEGSLYKIGAIGFKGDMLYDNNYLLKTMKSKVDQTFRASLYQEDTLTLTDLYQDKGYAFCEVTPLTVINDEIRTVNLTFDFAKGQEIFVNRVNIFGNAKTRDKVVRRELRLAEGDRWSATKLKSSKRRLVNTTYFKDVDMKIVKTDEPDKINLDVKLEEKPTGTLNMGIGYSTSEKIILSGSISQENFFGTGRKVFLDAAVGSITKSYRFTYVEPYLLDKNISTAISLFNFTRVMDNYDYKQSGGSISFVRPLTDFVKAGIKYRYETTNVGNISYYASSTIQDAAGTLSTSSITWSLSNNTIDNIMNPSKGVRSEISYELAGGPLMGDNYFNKGIGVYARYIPAGFWDSVFFMRGTAGIIRPYGGKPIPIYEKFYVGGIQTVRGFKYGYAGPRDVNGDPLGGNNQLYFNLEWIFPIYKPAGLKGVLFFDIGHGFEDSSGWLLNGAKKSAGFGIRWFSPMGPIRLELGFNLSPQNDEKASVFDFTMGTQY
ncbi:MAG: outer membrane protein assembly factor BamA [Syntrophus sp. (in: bacteria)]|nr:outer membrane protein assembly factor BamA [Syntrophus sp. (in: bacteria)]